MTTTKLEYVSYRPKKNVAWDDYVIDPLIKGLLDIIDKNEQYFLVIASILERYNDPDNDIPTQELRNKAVLDSVKLYPQTKDNQDETDKLIVLLNDLYSVSSQEIGDIRGKVLEAVIYKYGPKNFSVLTNTIKCLEAEISLNSTKIGGNNCDFDFTYHSDNGHISSTPDYFECKATIDGHVILGESMSLLKEKKRKKWEYALSVSQDLLTQTGIQPKIYFACFNSSTDDFQTHVNNNGYNCVEILNARNIFKLLH